jgi:DNA polymerase III epsilon subunit family exonuclease
MDEPDASTSIRAEPTLASIPLVFLDVETTGTSPLAGERITELALIRVESGRIVAAFQSLIDPQHRVHPWVSQFTGITAEMLHGKPTFDRIVPELLRITEDAVLVGHNVPFDLSFIASELIRADVSVSWWMQNRRVLDTLRIARKSLGRSGNGLQRLAGRFAVHPTTAHRAMADVETTLAVFEHLINPLGGWSLSLRDLLRHQGGPVKLHPRWTTPPAHAKSA